MPLELLDDLKVLHEMTIEMAKTIYLEQNQERKRVPKNFTQGVSFELEGLDEGSTIPKIIIIYALAGMLPSWNVTYFEQASERIKEIIQIASDDGDIKSQAPQTVLAYFNRFGKKLKDNEYIDFRPEDPDRKARFTRNTRRKLISASSTSGEYTEDVSKRGIICEMDKNKFTFQIQTVDGKKIPGKYDEVIHQQFLNAFSASDGNQKVIINGIGLFSHYEKLKELKSVEEVILLDEYDLGYRLDELSQLKEGWYNGFGSELNSDALKWFEKLYETNIDTEDITTYAFPTPEGDLQLEWKNDVFNIELLVDLKNKTGSLFAFNHNDVEDEIEKELDLNDIEDWKTLNNLLTSKLLTK
jgi:hypothetical protein